VPNDFEGNETCELKFTLIDDNVYPRKAQFSLQVFIDSACAGVEIEEKVTDSLPPRMIKSEIGKSSFCELSFDKEIDLPQDIASWTSENVGKDVFKMSLIIDQKNLDQIVLSKSFIGTRQTDRPPVIESPKDDVLPVEGERRWQEEDV